MAEGTMQHPPSKGAFLPTQLTFLPAPQPHPSLLACISSPTPISLQPGASLQSSRPRLPKVPGTEDSPALPWVPMSVMGSPISPGSQQECRLIPGTPLPPSQPTPGLHLGCWSFPQTCLHSPRDPALCWPGPFSVGSLESALPDDPASHQERFPPNNMTQIPTGCSPPKNKKPPRKRPTCLSEASQTLSSWRRPAVLQAYPAPGPCT